MAAFMVRCRLCLGYQLMQNSSKRNATTNAYYVLLPEVPPDTPESNPLLRYQENPQFSSIDPDKIVTGCAKLAINYDVELGKHIDSIKDPEVEKSFHSLIDPVEKLSVPLNYAWRTAKHLSYVQDSETYKQAFHRIHPQVERAKNERWVSHKLHLAVKEVRAEDAGLDQYQKRLLDMYLLEARLNGIEIFGSDRTKFIQILGKLVDVKNHFRNRVMLSHNLFSHQITNFEEVVEFPKSLVAQLAVDKSNPSRGPWRVTLNQNIYQSFLQHCSHRLLRWNVWQAYNNRSSFEQDSQNLSNHNLIKDIRLHRKDIAEMLGYENFAAMSMETKMAGSVDNVLNMIESLKTKLYPQAVEEIKQLQEYANSEGFHSPLEMWDVPFWRRRQRSALYRVEEEDFLPYFPYPKVLEGLFELCSTLFGIEIKDETDRVDIWHKDARYYSVFDSNSGEELGSFYVDPYSRAPSKLAGAWVETGRERSSLMGTKPMSYMNLNLSPPFAGRPSLMTTDEAATLFFEFGHVLQQVLTVIPYSELAGQKNIEWDSQQTCAVFMSMLFYQPEVLQSVSGHLESGEPLSEANANVIRNMRKHLSSYDLMRQLYVSAFDMEMYISEEYWTGVMKNIWKEFIPMPLSEEDNHPCSMTQIFSDQYPAAYYSFIWSDMIAADILSAFTEVGLDNTDKVAAVGKRFRDTYLSLGGGVSAGEVFRRFRGRDPSMEPYMKFYSKKS